MPDDLVAQARRFAQASHQGYQLRNGSAYIGHLERVAQKLTELNAPEHIVAAAYLHDVFYPPRVGNKDLRTTVQETFPDSVYRLAYEVHEYREIRYNVTENEDNAAYWQQRLLFNSDAAIIKIVDILDIIRDISRDIPEQVPSIARAISDVYSVVALKLGLRVFRYKFEDFVQEILRRDAHTQSEKWLQVYEKNYHKLASHKRFLEQAFSSIPELTVRMVPLNRYHLYLRLGTMDSQMSLEDTVLFIMTTPKRDTCLQLRKQMLDRFTLVRSDDNFNIKSDSHYGFFFIFFDKTEQRFFRIMLRTENMHQLAEWGVAAKWQPKAPEVLEGVEYIYERIETDRILEAKHLENTMAYESQKFGYTKDGRLIFVPLEATVSDFIYAMGGRIAEHTAKIFVNNLEINPDYRFKSGSVIEVRATRGHGVIKEKHLATPASRESASESCHARFYLLTINEVGVTSRVASVFHHEEQNLHAFHVLSIEGDRVLFFIEIADIKKHLYKDIKRMLEDLRQVLLVCDIDDVHDNESLSRIDAERRFITYFENIQKHLRGGLRQQVPRLGFKSAYHQALFDLFYTNQGKLVDYTMAMECLDGLKQADDEITSQESCRKTVSRMKPYLKKDNRWEIKTIRGKGWKLMPLVPNADTGR